MRKKNAHLLIVFLISATLSAGLLVDFDAVYTDGKGQWVHVTDTPKTGGYGECVVNDDNYIYILRQWKAGYTPSFNSYDPDNDAWVDLSGNLPAEDFKNGVAMTYDYRGNLYVLTGSAYDDGAERVAFYRYNISEDSWTRLGDTPHVQGAGDAIVYSDYDGNIYAFLGRAHYTGSYDPGTYSIFARYNISTDSWHALSFPDWPGTDDGASLAWTGGKYIYALEGEFYENEPVRNFARYDIENDTWESMSPIPARDGVGDGGSLLWIGYYDPSQSDYIYALDGNGCNETPGYNFTLYHVSTDTWEKLDSLPAPGGYYVGNRLAYHGGKIYYWQGTPSTWSGGGKGIYSYNVPAIPEFFSEGFVLSMVLLLGVTLPWRSERHEA